MATRTLQPENNTIYFVTFKCFKWMNLIHYSQVYFAFYKWFDYLISNHVCVVGFVIMPNHFHGIFYLKSDCRQTINKLLANGKRFIAYEIIGGLIKHNYTSTLDKLAYYLSVKEKRSGKKHHIFSHSSDIKKVYNRNMLLTKLNYIHNNPCVGKWKLADNKSHYEHSSAAFYDLGSPNRYITHYVDI